MKIQIVLDYQVTLTNGKEGPQKAVIKKLIARFEGVVNAPALPPAGTILFPVKASPMDLVVKEIQGCISEKGIIDYRCFVESEAEISDTETGETESDALLNYLRADREWLELSQLKLEDSIKIGLWDENDEPLIPVELPNLSDL